MYSITVKQLFQIHWKFSDSLELEYKYIYKCMKEKSGSYVNSKYGLITTYIELKIEANIAYPFY